MLGDAIIRLADQADIKLKVMSLDRDRDGMDLTAEQPFGDLLDMARTGQFDRCHAGFPCGSFSRVRYRQGSGPPPVRSLEFIYGLPTNNPRQQGEADRGSLLAIRSTQVTAEVLQCQRHRKVPECGTLENPPGSDDRMEGPSWEFPEVDKFMKDFGCEEAVFNTCAYQLKERVRWFKPAKFAGRLRGLSSLKRKCQCPKYFKHEPLIGKEKTSKAAKYPKDLVLEYAKLVIKVFRTVLELEWWRHKQVQSASELNQVKQSWAQSKERMAIKRPVDHKDMSQLRGAKRAWNAGDLQRDQLPQGPSQSKKARREDENSFFIGGMRNPYKSLKKMTILQEAGNDMARAWNALVKDMPQALEAARTYGSERCELDPQVLDEWVTRLNSMMKATTPTDVDLKGKYQFRSPLKPELWEAWQKFSKDPEKHIADWARFGAPLGMGAQIPRSNGVFPPVEYDSGEGQLSTLETQLDAKNYKSVYDDREGAQGELDRLVGKGFAEIVPMTEIRQKFRTGTVSKLALITKIKPNGTVKYSLIIDLLRLGGNSLANIPERIVLPRVQDVVKDIQELWQQHGGQPQGVDWGMELVGADLSDAYCHFGVAPEELCIAWRRHCRRTRWWSSRQ